MNINRIIGGPIDANCYVVTFNTQAIIIDPCVKLDLIKKAIGDYKLAFIILTHGHYDHFCNLKEIEDYYNVKIYLAKNAIEKLEDANKNCSALIGMPNSVKYNKDTYHIVNDYEKVEVDGSLLTFMHTPGHSDCSICIRIEDSFFSGDTVFYQGIGRCDLYSGNEAIMRKTLKELKAYFINKCPKDMVVYPGHEESVTVDYLLKTNQYFID